MAKKTERIRIEVGSGNVFRDLGRSEPDERQLRTRLALQINDILAARQLPQAQVARLLGIPQPHVSELKHYKLSRFSSERLLRFLTCLDRDVEIVIRPKAGRKAVGVLVVSVA